MANTVFAHEKKGVRDFAERTGHHGPPFAQL